MAKTRPSAISASRTRSPRITSAPAVNSKNGIATPTAQSDHTVRKVSANGRKYLRACWSGPNWKTFQKPAMKKVRPRTSRANNSAQLRPLTLLCSILAFTSGQQRRNQLPGEKLKLSNYFLPVYYLRAFQFHSYCAVGKFRQYPTRSSPMLTKTFL